MTSDAPYLGASCAVGPSAEVVLRSLSLKGSFNNGLTQFTDSSLLDSINTHNANLISSLSRSAYDAILLGNIDLLGIEIIHALLEFSVPILHHIGFIAPPYDSSLAPSSPLYNILAASKSVKESLVQAGFTNSSIYVVYPGIRPEYYSTLSQSPALTYSLSLHRQSIKLGTVQNPVKIGFAGLLMASKGVHILCEALLRLHQQGIAFQACLQVTVFKVVETPEDMLALQPKIPIIHS